MLPKIMQRDFAALEEDTIYIYAVTTKKKTGGFNFFLDHEGRKGFLFAVTFCFINTTTCRRSQRVTSRQSMAVLHFCTAGVSVAQKKAGSKKIM